MTPFVPWILNQCWEKRYISFSIKLKTLKSPYEEFCSHTRQKVEIFSFYSHRDKMWIGNCLKTILVFKMNKRLTIPDITWNVIDTKHKVHNVCTQLLSHAQLFVILWTAACQPLLSMEYSRQEHWSGLPFPTPEST